MDVNQKEKKAFSLGKKYSQIVSDTKKLRAMQKKFFVTNYKLINADESKMGNMDIDIRRVQDTLDSHYVDDFVERIESVINELNSSLIDCKLNFISVVEENTCCDHKSKL